MLRLGAGQVPAGNVLGIWEWPTAYLPALSGLAPNYPNPFNAGTRLFYRLSDPGPVRLEVFNVLGQRVRTLVDEFRKAGSYQVHWDARDQGGAPAAAGVYVTCSTRAGSRRGGWFCSSDSVHPPLKEGPCPSL